MTYPTPSQIERKARQMNPLIFSTTWYDMDGNARQGKSIPESSRHARRWALKAAREELIKGEE
jgi:hypothetical protein